MIEVRDIGPIAEAYPALHMRLGEFHSKRHAKEQQRLAKMLEAKAQELGVSPDSTIITKIKEKAEALIENPGKPTPPVSGVDGIKPFAVLIILEATKCISAGVVSLTALLP